MRSSARKELRNRTAKSRLRTAEKKLLTLLKKGQKEEASNQLKLVHSYYDKAAKTGVIHPSTADRKKSRLKVRLNKTEAAQ